MADTLAGSLRDELLALLEPLASAGSPAGLRAMLQSFGHPDALAEQTALQTAMQQAAALADELRRLDDTALAGWDGLARALQAAADTFDAVRSVEQAISDPALLAQAQGLGERIASRSSRCICAPAIRACTGRLRCSRSSLRRRPRRPVR